MNLPWARSRKRNAQAGFGMVEAMVSLLLLMISAAGGLAMLLATLYATQYSTQSQAATRLAQEVIDKAMSEPFANLGNSGGTGSVVCQTTGPINSAPADLPAPMTNVYSTGANADVAGTPPAGNTTVYHRTCLVTNLGVFPANMKVVQVTSSWRDKNGQQRTIRMAGQRAQQ